MRAGQEGIEHADDRAARAGGGDPHRKGEGGDAADGYAAAQVLQAAVEAVGSIDDQEALANWLRDNSVDTILGTLSWDDTGAPEQAFLLAQWQNGDEEIVLPEESATTDTIVNPKPAWTK